MSCGCNWVKSDSKIINGIYSGQNLIYEYRKNKVWNMQTKS